MVASRERNVAEIVRQYVVCQRQMSAQRRRARGVTAYGASVFHRVSVCYATSVFSQRRRESLENDPVAQKRVLRESRARERVMVTERR